MIGILRWLPVSLALHLAALAATLLLPRETALLPLFVDLTLSAPPLERPVPEGRSAARESGVPARRPRIAARPASPPAAPARTATLDALSPASAPTPSAPEPPPSSRAAVPTPMPAASPAPEASAESSVVPPQPAPPPVSSGTSAGGVSTFESPAGGVDGASPSAAAGAVGGSDPAGWAGAAGGQAGGVSARGGAESAGETLALAIPGDDGGAYAGYISLLRRRVQQALTYPSAARRRGISGTVHLDITVEPSGRIADVQVVRSSSHDLLDVAALDAVRALGQVPFPPNVRPRPVRVRLPVVFELR